MDYTDAKWQNNMKIKVDYNNMMEEIRTALDEGRFHSYKEEKLYGMKQGPEGK